MQTIQCTIQGISPLLIHSFPLIPIEGLQNMEPKAQCEAHVYRDPESKQLCVPAINVQRALISGAGFQKGKRGASLSKPFAACVVVAPERLTLGVSDFEIDSRAVVIAATKGRIVRHRARLSSWKLTFEIEYDEVLLKPAEIRKAVDDTGSRVGLLDFRPEKKGPFGRFMVSNWK